MAEDLIGYDQLMQDAMRGVVRAALSRAVGSPAGPPGRHHFYLTFRTGAPGVVIPQHLAKQYTDEMTIVLEHQFWDLEVHPDRFRVILKFGGQPYPIAVPFSAVTRFYDPSVQFALQFEQPATPDAVEDPAEDQPASAAAGAPAAAAIVSLDAFRKK